MSQVVNNKSIPILKLGCALVIVSMLSACGFHLRGDYQLPPQMTNTYIKTANKNSELFRALKRMLKASDIHIVESPQQAQAILTLDDEKQSKRVLSVDEKGRAREYEINYQVRFGVTTDMNDFLIPQQTIQMQGDFLFDTEDVLGKGREEATLIKDMQHDVVRLIMLRIQSATKKTSP